MRKTGHVERLNKALNLLGPTYVKFGQTLATRPDVVGVDIANDLAGLQDRMDPFDAGARARHSAERRWATRPPS